MLSIGQPADKYAYDRYYFIPWCYEVKFYLIAKLPETESSILFKPRSDVGVQPATLILQSLGQIPVIDGNSRFYSSRFQFRYQVLVILYARWILGTGPLRQDPGPRDGESVVGRSQLTDDPGIFLIIVVTGVGSIAYPVFGPRVPNAQSFAVCVPASFNLMKGPVLGTIVSKGPVLGNNSVLL